MRLPFTVLYLGYLFLLQAAVRALDTINAFTAQQRPGTNITKFMASGGSKRGWITWLLGCTDRRMIGVAPIVISILNFTEVCSLNF